MTPAGWRWSQPSISKSSNYGPEALATLDRIAARLLEIGTESISTDDPAVEFILAMDKETAQEALRAIVARAFWSAEAYARAVAARRDDIENSKKYVQASEAAMNRFAGKSGAIFDKGEPSAGLAEDNLAVSALERADRFRDEKFSSEREELAAAFALLEKIAATNRSMAEEPCPSKKEARFFFVLRLAEAFTILFRRKPDFYDRKGSSAATPSTQMKAPEW